MKTKAAILKVFRGNLDSLPSNFLKLMMQLVESEDPKITRRLEQRMPQAEKDKNGVLMKRGELRDIVISVVLELMEADWSGLFDGVDSKTCSRISLTERSRTESHDHSSTSNDDYDVVRHGEDMVVHKGAAVGIKDSCNRMRMRSRSPGDKSILKSSMVSRTQSRTRSRSSSRRNSFSGSGEEKPKHRRVRVLDGDMFVPGEFSKTSVLACNTAKLELELGAGARQKKESYRGEAADSLTYGEVDFKELCKVLIRTVSFGKGGVFYDLGSGPGTGVALATLLHDFDKVVGIELLHGLHKIGVQVVQRLDRFRRARSHQYTMRTEQEVRVVRSDLRLYDWSDATLCYCTLTCFDENLRRDLAMLAQRCQVGTVFVTTSFPLLFTDHYEEVAMSYCHMGWGWCKVYTQIKVKEPSKEDRGPICKENFLSSFA